MLWDLYEDFGPFAEECARPKALLDRKKQTGGYPLKVTFSAHKSAQRHSSSILMERVCERCIW